MEDKRLQESIERLIQAYQELREKVEETISELQKIV
jgi:hypothetical protein